jgi:hypothetical protein
MAYRSFLLYLLLRPFTPTVKIGNFIKKNPTVKSTVERVEAQALMEESRRRPRPHTLVPAVR